MLFVISVLNAVKYLFSQPLKKYGHNREDAETLLAQGGARGEGASGTGKRPEFSPPPLIPHRSQTVLRAS